MLYNEIVSREFVGGVLAGITIEQKIYRVSDPAEVGTKRFVRSTFGSDYIDTVIGHEVNSCL